MKIDAEQNKANDLFKAGRTAATEGVCRKRLSIQRSSDNLQPENLGSASEAGGDIIIDVDDDGKLFLCGAGLNFKNAFIDKAAQSQQIDF